jgi:RHS repeat-associated protein
VLADPLHLSHHQRTPSPPPLSSSCSSHRSAKLKTSDPCNHRNQQYSIIGLTNAAGTLVERYSYTAYGTLSIYAANGTVRTSSTYANRYTYTGREYDADLNLYHFRARWYDPTTGGFISRDPLGYVDGMSLYRGYFGVAGLDYSGMDTCKCTRVKVGHRAPIVETTYEIGSPCSSLDRVDGLSPKTCKPYDGDVTPAYCRAAKANPQNGWLQCACDNSGTIGSAMYAMEDLLGNALARLLGYDLGDDLQGKVDWFRCTRMCLSDEWKKGYTQKQLVLPQTGDYWPLCWRPCDLNSGNVGCCELQVFAEQAELQNCMTKCGPWKWGNSFPINVIPGWSGDFNDFDLRNIYGVKTCCGPKYYPEHYQHDGPPPLGYSLRKTPLQEIEIFY